ncbi:hypothetical protein [Jatrophihabitans sp.]|uniref:hypothetical protein n=1 Tax=Jatrophihabitans sp. TaxID=1932789 RepID=UPI002EF5E309
MERLGYALLGLSPLLSIEEIANVTWKTEPCMLAIYVELTSGPIINVNVNVGLDSSGAGLTNVVMAAFDLAQEALAERRGIGAERCPRAGQGIRTPPLAT